MINIKEPKDCCGCEACSNICPKQCISMRLNEGFYYPEIDNTKCINCNLCETVCPIINHTETDGENKFGIAGYIKDHSARVKSTSGGIAYLLCKYVVENNGLAYGVSFDSNFNSIFSGASDIEELKQQQGSKYPQSRVGRIYAEIEKVLCNGKTVIFVGTPCQVYGLSNYLRKDYNNLFLIDLICHGVPSPEVWQDYLKNMFHDEIIKSVVFKHKEIGWKRWNVRIETDKRIYSQERTDDIYMSSYLCGYNVRPSCFSCNFKEDSRKADITIADGWGVPEEDREINDDKGLSSLIINTKKGRQLFDLVKNELIFKEFSVDELVRGNVAYSRNITQNLFRNKYLNDIQKKGVLITLNKYAINSPYGKICMKISNYINRLMERKNG